MKRDVFVKSFGLLVQPVFHTLNVTTGRGHFIQRAFLRPNVHFMLVRVATVEPCHENDQRATSPKHRNQNRNPGVHRRSPEH